MEGFGADGEAVQVNGVLEARWNVKILEFLIGISGQLIRPQLTTLLGQGIQGVTASG